MQDFKERLLIFCSTKIGENIRLLQEELLALKASLENETKSSVGDKHETARARMQAEEEKLTTRLQEIKEQAALFERLDKKLLRTDAGLFLLGIALGTLRFEDQTIYVISPQSPIGQVLRHCLAGQRLNFNGKSIAVLEVL